jgi:ABC-2 type transport system permease protein
VSAAVATARRGLGEVRKVPAFVRRDFLVLLSYRVAFAGDFVHIGVQAVLFSFIGKLVDPALLPAYGGSPTTYMQFAMIGVILSLITALLLRRVATAVRQEQMIGTLEALLTTPTAPTTVQAGSVAFDLLFIPVRMGGLLLAVTLVFGLDFQASGVLPALAVLVAYVPFVWGLGLVTAATIVTFRRGTGVLAAGMGFLGIASGAFFPLALLPGWLQGVAEANPIAIAIEAVREALIGGGGWGVIGTEVLVMVPVAGFSLFLGVTAFRAALAREHRRGTLGLY